MNAKPGKDIYAKRIHEIEMERERALAAKRREQQREARRAFWVGQVFPVLGLLAWSQSI